MCCKCEKLQSGADCNVLLFKIVYLLTGLKPVHCIKLDLFLAVQWTKTFQHFCLIGDRLSVNNQIK